MSRAAVAEIVEKRKNLIYIFKAEPVGEALDQWVLTGKTCIKLGKLWKKQVEQEEEWENKEFYFESVKFQMPFRHSRGGKSILAIEYIHLGLRGEERAGDKKFT